MDKVDKWQFVWIPKNAGTSIHTFLSEITPPKQIDGSEIHFHWKTHTFDIVSRFHSLISNEEYPDRLRFCVSRNPYDRAVCQYYWSRRQHKKLGITDFPQYCEWLNDPNTMWAIKPYKHDLFCPQSDYSGRINAVLRYEHLQDDWEAFCVASGVPHAELGLSNKGDYYRDKRPAWQPHYAGKCAELVFRKYREDFERFGYSERIE